MNSRLNIQIITALVVAVFAVGIWASGDTPRLQWLRYYSAAVMVVLLALSAWNHWLWRLPLLQGVAKIPRDIRGTWRGSLDFFWKEDTDSSPPKKAVYLVVRQSAWRVSVVLFTNESRSTSSLATVSSDGVTASLDYMYLNRPDSRLEKQSRIHHGSASLDIVGRPASRLRGRYWTNRDSRGELDFTERVPRIAEDYQEAQRAFITGE